MMSAAPRRSAGDLVPQDPSADSVPYVAPGPEKKALKYMKKVKHMEVKAHDSQ